MGEYLKKMKKLANNLTLAGHPVTMDDFVSHILVGLDSNDYNPMVFQISERENFSWIELQAKLLSYGNRMEHVNAGITSINLGKISKNFASNRNAGNSLLDYKLDPNWPIFLDAWKLLKSNWGVRKTW